MGGEELQHFQGQVHLPAEPGHASEPRAAQRLPYTQPHWDLPAGMERRPQAAALLQGTGYWAAVNPSCAPILWEYIGARKMHPGHSTWAGSWDATACRVETMLCFLPLPKLGVSEWDPRAEPPAFLHPQVFNFDKLQEKKTWIAAQEFCRELGAQLLSLGSYEEEHFVANTLNKIFG